MTHILQALSWRYATKAFDAEKKIPANQLEDLFEALRLSPSSYGLQPWKFIHVKNPEIRAQIQANAWNQSQVTEASDLIVIASKIILTPEDIEHFISFTAQTQGVDASALDGYKNMMLGTIASRTPETLAAWNARQAYISAGVLLTSAASMEIDACPMEGFDPSKVDEILGLKELGYTSLLLIPVGYRKEEDGYASRKKVRYPKEEVLHIME